MMNRALPFLAICILLAAPTLLSAAEPAKEPTFTDILATRPAPDLATLADRAGPDESVDTTGPFYDLLKLRNEPDPKAFPVLKKVLETYGNSTRIHAFAAAQALFTLHSDVALATLDQNLLSPEYPATLAIMYTYHWEMPAQPRSEFIKKYLLKNLAEDASLTVSAGPMKDGTLPVTVAFTNLGKEPTSILDTLVSADHLYFENAAGAIAWTRDNGITDRDLNTRWITLAPKEKYEQTFTLHAKTLTAADRPDPSLPPDQKLYLESSGSHYLLGKPGTFKIYAMVFCPVIPKKDQAAFRTPDGAIWSGRAVSKPVEVKIEDASSNAP